MGSFLGLTELGALAAGAVQTVDVADGAVTTAKILNDNVVTAKILNKTVTAPKLDERTVQYAEVEILSAEILNLFAAPKELVAAPGAGFALEFISCLLNYDNGGVDYVPGAAVNLTVNYTDGVGAVASTAEAVTGFLDAAGVDAIRMLNKLEATITPVAAAALVLCGGTGSPTTGDGVIHAKVAYRVHATGL